MDQARALHQWAWCTLNCAAQAAGGLHLVNLYQASSGCLPLVAQQAQQLCAGSMPGFGSAPSLDQGEGRDERGVSLVGSSEDGAQHAGLARPFAAVAVQPRPVSSAELEALSEGAGQQAADQADIEHSLAFMQALSDQMQAQGLAAGRVLLRCVLLLQALWPLVPGLEASDV